MIESTSPVPRQPADLLREQPPVRVEPDARARIRAANVASGRRIAVLDDDPTGSQTVHDVAVVTALEPKEFAAGLATPGSTCFILTNTRSLPEAQAVKLNTTVGRALWSPARSSTPPSSWSVAATPPCAATSSPNWTRWTPSVAT
jgi:hypothetical protein